MRMRRIVWGFVAATTAAWLFGLWADPPAMNGRGISHDDSAYTYLPASIRACPQGEAMRQCLLAAGFREATFRRLTCGIFNGKTRQREKSAFHGGLPPGLSGEGCGAGRVLPRIFIFGILLAEMWATVFDWKKQPPRQIA